MVAKQLIYREEAPDKIRRDGAISIEDGSGLASELEVVEGMQFDRGFLSPSFINNAERRSAVLEDDRAFGYNAATREYGDLLQTGAIDPAKVTRLALQHASSIASLILTTDCLIANAPAPKAPAAPGMPGAQGPEF